MIFSPFEYSYLHIYEYKPEDDCIVTMKISNKRRVLEKVEVFRLDESHPCG